jgi:CRP/FNR family transcriptional regulator
MDRYLKSTNCKNCISYDNCFIKDIENNENIYPIYKKHIKYNKGETIVKEGSMVSDILYVIDGLVKVYIEGPDKNIIIKILKSNDFIGLTSLFGDSTYYFSAAALKETNICCIEQKDIKNLMLDCCKFSHKLAHWYCNNYNIMLTKCLNLGFRQLNGKLANVLLYLTRDEFENVNIFKYISRKDLAELSGMSVESVVRILTDFKNDNIIRLNGKQIEIINLEKLRMLNQKG